MARDRGVWKDTSLLSGLKMLTAVDSKGKMVAWRLVRPDEDIEEIAARWYALLNFVDPQAEDEDGTGGLDGEGRVSEPVRAASPGWAIRKLVKQCGGRLPAG